MRRVPRSTLNRNFVRAVRASGRSLVALANLSGFAAYTQLVRLLTANRVPASDLTIARLRAVAKVVNYDGEIFAVRRG